MNEYGRSHFAGVLFLCDSYNVNTNCIECGERERKKNNRPDLMRMHCATIHASDNQTF